MQRMKRNYKDGIFRMLFNDLEKIKELYEALSGGEKCRNEDIEIVTPDNAIFGDVKNDLAFMIKNTLIFLTEHQSTVNPNIPLRMLFYIAKELEKYFSDRAIYGKTTMKIPKPYFYVFYNGTDEQPMEREYKLSDLFPQKCGTMTIEVAVKVINVNYEKGAAILTRSKTLSEYSRFIYTVREKEKHGLGKNTAIEESIKECINKGILSDFLMKNGGDVVSILYQALTQEEIVEIAREDAFCEGRNEGLEARISQTKTATARKMLEKGMELNLISDITGLSEEEIRALF